LSDSQIEFSDGFIKIEIIEKLIEEIPEFDDS